MPDDFVGKAAPLAQAAFDAVVAGLDVDAASLWSLMAVETGGFGFQPDRRPKILFERHIFHKRTDGKFSATNPDISNKDAGGYIGGAGEYGRLAKAMALDRAAALESASWGLPQIMGFNAAKLHYSSAEDMVTQFETGEDTQLDACMRFIKATPALEKAFKKRDWPTVAFFYNGSGYAKNKYDVKLGQHYDLYQMPGRLPDIEIRAAQARLTYLGFDPRGVDGAAGQGTAVAVISFQKAKGLAPTGDVNDVKAALIEAAGV